MNEDNTIASAQDYDPFGGILTGRSYVLGASSNKYKFTEKERDVESDFDYFGARYYDSEIKRWLSVDPMADKYPGWSPYNYCMNNPMVLVDLQGMWNAEYDKKDNKIIVKYEDGDTFEDLRNQLGMTEDQFKAWASSQGIDISNGPEKSFFDITKNVLDNTNFDPDFTGSNCHGFVSFVLGNINPETMVNGNEMLKINKLSDLSKKTTPSIGDVAVFTLAGNLVFNTGFVIFKKDDPGHSAIYLLKNHAGDSQYLNRINTNKPVTINTQADIVTFFNNEVQRYIQQYKVNFRSIPFLNPTPTYYGK